MDNNPPRPPSGRYRWTWAIAPALLVACFVGVTWTALFSAGGRAGPAMKATVPPHLGWVPPEATFFVHLRVADLWNGADGKILREEFPDLERSIVESFEREVGISAAETETITLVIPSFDGAFDRHRGREKGFERKFKDDKGV